MKDRGPTRRDLLYGAAAAACLPRLRPHVCASLADLDRFVAAVERIRARGL